MKKFRSIIWGVALILIGVIFALNSTGVAEIRGWGAYLLLIPGIVGLFTRKKKLLSIVVILGGVFLLMKAYDVIDSGLTFKLILPGAIVLVGALLIYKGIRDKVLEKRRVRINSLRMGRDSYAAFFRRENASYSGKNFNGAEINSVFGNTRIDLTDAIIDDDCYIDISAIFGHAEIILPDNVRLDERSEVLFGGVSDKTAKNDDYSLPTVYVDSICMFGGVEIK